MRMFTLVSLVAVGLGLALVGGEPAYARTPVPTATPTATSTPSPTPTPSPQQIAVFRGQAWLNGRASGGPITARIGDVICSEPSISITPADSTETLYTMRVLSNDLRPGCGQPGAGITFFVEDNQASQTALWQAGGDQFLTLIAGPPFARFSGTLSNSRTLNESVVPFINNQACGYPRGSGFVDPEHTYATVVFSDEQQPGCGTEGAQITFKLVDAQGNVIAVAAEKGVWHAWGGHDSQQLNLTMAPVGGPSIKIGNVGTGGSQHSGTLWRKLSLVLAAVGLGGVSAGSALRKRAM